MNWRFKLSMRLALLRDILVPSAVILAGCTADSSGRTAATAFTAPQNEILVASVSVAPSAPQLVTGGTQQLTATLRDTAGAILTGRPITWSSSDTAVAGVSSAGLVTARAVGGATIRATSAIGISGSAAVTVGGVAQPVVASITISPSPVALAAGGTAQLTATPRDSSGAILTGLTVTWTTNAAAIAAITAGGLVTGVSAGTATLTAQAGGRSASTSATVQAPAAGAITNPASLVPVGYTDIVFRDFLTVARTRGDRGTGTYSMKIGGSEGWDDMPERNGGANLALVSTAPGLKPMPYGLARAMQVRFPAGFVAGASPAGAQSLGFSTNHGGAAGTMRFQRIAALFTVAFTPGFQAGPSGLNKLFFLNMVNGMGGNPFLGVKNGQFRFNLQGTPQNARGFLANNVNAAAATPIYDGRWYSIMILAGLNPDDTRANGTLDIWVADHSAGGAFVKVASYADIDWRQGAGTHYWSNAAIFPIWGGTGGTVSRTFYEYFGRTRIWGSL